jgi:hypothetical protein
MISVVKQEKMRRHVRLVDSGATWQWKPSQQRVDNEGKII